MSIADLAHSFSEKFDVQPDIYAASPGRINLIGEHTDYNNGFVMPASINYEARVAIKTNSANQYRLFAIDLDEYVELDTAHLKPHGKQWANYLLGVIDQLRLLGHELPGFDCVMTSNVPQGAGLSSSAAIECALVKALNVYYKLELDDWAMVKVGQGAENGFVGANTGILDQFASVFGEADTALLLDCRSLEVKKQIINLPKHSLIVLNTGVKHNHVTSGYSDRRADCERAVSSLQTQGWVGESLRDLKLEDLEKHKSHLDENAFKRARFVVEENQRVLSSAIQLTQGDALGFGKNLLAGHWGLSKDYEVSCPESDAIVEFAEEHDACLGARQMGGGFGGCVLCLVENDSVDDFIDQAQQDYFNHFAISLEPLNIHIGPGARIIE